LKPLSDEQYQQLTHTIYRDLTIDTLGNLALGFGLFLVFSDNASSWPLWVQSPICKALLIATGVINLRFIFTRFNRLQLWQAARQERQNR
jgi:hypothetical protein